MRYAFQALCVNEFENGPQDGIGHLCDPTDPTCKFPSGDAWLDEFLGFQNANIVSCMLYLVAIIGAFNVVAYIVLCVRKPSYLQFSTK